jgi:heterodisulfide reductase subunit C
MYDTKRSAVIQPGLDPELAARIKRRSRTDFSRCLLCFTCSSGCPFTEAMDAGPHRIMRMLQLGLVQEALESSTIWICVGCDTCSSRCPMAIDIAAVMDVLREKALEEGAKIACPEIVNLHDSILRSIQQYGRTHKLDVMLRYKFKQKTWFRDMDIGLRMLAKRKLDLLPSKVKQIGEIQSIFHTDKPENDE